MIHYRQLLILLAIPLILTACEKAPPDDSKVLAKVNGDKITENNYDHYLKMRRSRNMPVPPNMDEKEFVLNEMIEMRLLTQYAEEKGLDKDLEVYFLLQRVRENLLAQAALRNEAKELTISDEQVKKRFEEESKNMHDKEYRVRHILLRSEADAKDVLKRLKAGANFASLAKLRSMDTNSAKNGGELGEWINDGMVVAEFFNALKTLNKGQMTSEPVKSNFGWHIIKVDNIRPRKIPTYEEFIANQQAVQALKRQIREEHNEALVKQLKEKAKVTIN